MSYKLLDKSETYNIGIKYLLDGHVMTPEIIKMTDGIFKYFIEFKFSFFYDGTQIIGKNIQELNGYKENKIHFVLYNDFTEQEKTQIKNFCEINFKVKSISTL